MSQKSYENGANFAVDIQEYYGVNESPYTSPEKALELFDLYENDNSLVGQEMADFYRGYLSCFD